MSVHNQPGMSNYGCCIIRKVKIHQIVSSSPVIISGRLSDILCYNVLCELSLSRRQLLSAALGLKSHLKWSLMLFREDCSLLSFPHVFWDMVSCRKMVCSPIAQNSPVPTLPQLPIASGEVSYGE